MATDTSRVSSYIRGEGYYDSAGTFLSATFTRVNSAMADTSGLTVTAATLNNLSGLTIYASTLNLLSGLSAQASQLNYASSLVSSCNYAASAGVAANGIVGSAAYAIRFAAATADNAAVITHGLSTGVAVFVAARNATVIAGAALNTAATGFTVNLTDSAGTAVTGQAIYWMAIGNA